MRNGAQNRADCSITRAARDITRWRAKVSIRHFTFGWPTARIGVMEGDSAVQAIHGPELERLKAGGEAVPEDLKQRIERTRADYERWLDARYAAARGHVDALIDPLETRRVLGVRARDRDRAWASRAPCTGDPLVDDSNRERARLLGRLAGSPGAAGGARAHRLSGAGLSGRDHNVDSPEAEGGRSELWATRAIFRR